MWYSGVQRPHEAMPRGKAAVRPVHVLLWNAVCFNTFVRAFFRRPPQGVLSACSCQLITARFGALLCDLPPRRRIGMMRVSRCSGHRRKKVSAAGAFA